MLEINQPYVKKYNENGELLNPINGKFVSQNENRSMRKTKQERFFNNSKSFKLLVTKTAKFKKVIQNEINSETGKSKEIIHYLKLKSI
jgi:hypothetical protein